ncbi:type III-B CRISPR-associated protein Cas10/Cmr2 [Scytonema hofmannii FACHB-248]|uniref:Type III-B CRISPR-associated protein Cas10/Cmr2 n=1 Tax=Scytonema hofmannii FACHB-248 TaxID=1842502 RepID=A0ABR8GKJ7_9CYAN|nr:MULTISPECIES: type III-B CRISPR-associated protein Cas10/Cmr2 [Nostocales]MBD2603858.1 type III-B CRISPR-associated protein Cas10/Cmr2 [Scytonema hofmannii FACHB-248]
MTNDSRTRTITALAWCLAWGEKHSLLQDELSALHQMRQVLSGQNNQGDKQDVPKSMEFFVAQAQQLYNIPEKYTPKTLEELEKNYPDLWKQETSIGLVFGGATKIKQYVFEAAKLNDIRGASALLDRINLYDIPGFFGQGVRSHGSIRQWLIDNGFGGLTQALIPELIIYSTGGSILAFCPAAFVDELANAIEKRYTDETLTANSCAVGDTFRLLEFRFGLLQNPIENTLWLDEYLQKQNNPIIQAYFDQSNEHDLEEKFWQRKNFNELVGKLANQFTHRRNGNKHLCGKQVSTDAQNDGDNKILGLPRPSRCYPPMFETHPYLQRDETDRRAAVAETNLPGTPSFSAALARKVIVGQRSKRDRQRQQWYQNFGFRRLSGDEELWETGIVRSWVSKFKLFLKKSGSKKEYYQALDQTLKPYKVTEAFSLREIGNVSTPRGFVGYIYADGNNMGGYIRNKIRTPQDYREFSKQVLDATQNSVYIALRNHLKPRQLNHLTDPDNINRNGEWIYPFEIVTIGGDDVLLIVPADKALDIAKTIGEEFEREILKSSEFRVDKPYDLEKVHRYQGGKQPEYTHQCELSMSAGVLITAENTPIYYAEALTNQLLKSSKKLAKDLKRDCNYYGGTVDFLALKAVTMIASNIKDFREQGLTKDNLNLKLYAAPYTLHELGGLLDTVEALKKAKFPKSQLYQIRSLLERGKRTAILNYRYFRVRLQQGQPELKAAFEEAWCQPKDENNHGNLAPWMSLKLNKSDTETEKTIYETIWRDLVDLYPFIATLQDGETAFIQGEQQQVNQ